MSTFQALWITETEDKKYERSIIERQVSDLPDGDVLIKVNYSSLNYKDGLSASGNKGVTRKFPHTPGIDAAGVVAESSDANFKEGDEVLVTGYDLGMNTPGGYGGYIRVPAGWVLKLPDGLSQQDSMLYGTAGFTAALCVDKLLRAGVTPDAGEILVTGASGGVGSVGVGILGKLGYQIVAGSGKPEAHDMLKKLGATEILSREELNDDSGRPMLKGRWAGVIDTVGGDILATAIKDSKYGGVVTCCGLVASPSLNTTVLPFILRGVELLGIDSVELPMAPRPAIWEHMATDWRFDGLTDLMTEVDLSTLKDVWIDKILQGQAQGRVVVKL